MSKPLGNMSGVFIYYTATVQDSHLSGAGTTLLNTILNNAIDTPAKAFQYVAVPCPHPCATVRGRAQRQHLAAERCSRHRAPGMHPARTQHAPSTHLTAATV